MSVYGARGLRPQFELSARYPFIPRRDDSLRYEAMMSEPWRLGLEAILLRRFDGCERDFLGDLVVGLFEKKEEEEGGEDGEEEG